MELSARTQRRSRRVGLLLLVVVLVIGVTSALAHRSIGRSQAPALAASIALRHADLPGFRQQADPITATERRLSARLRSCIGAVPDSRDYAQAQSPRFVSATAAAPVTVDSTSSILPSSALVHSDLAAATGARAKPCLESQLRSRLADTLPRGAAVSIGARRLPPPASGSDGAYEWRLTMLVTAHQGRSAARVPLYDDAIGIAWGQVEVGLDVLRTGRPPSLPLERRLAATLLARARAATR